MIWQQNFFILGFGRFWVGFGWLGGYHLSPIFFGIIWWSLQCPDHTKRHINILNSLQFFFHEMCLPSTCHHSGLSLKTQLLYALVFTTRYLDLFYSFYSLYNTLMKLFFLLTSYHIVFLMRYRFKPSYDSKNDTFRVRCGPSLCICCKKEENFLFRASGFLDMNHRARTPGSIPPKICVFFSLLLDVSEDIYFCDHCPKKKPHSCKALQDC